MRLRRPNFLLVLLLVLLGSSVAGVPAAGDEDAQATLRVLGARIRPLQPDGKAWDGDHRKIPIAAYHALSTFTGFPGLTLLSAVPYRNRPDPFVIVVAGDDELARSRAVQGSFAPAWDLVVALPADERPAVVAFRVVDSDLRKDDVIGQAVADVGALLKKPGTHVVEGSAGLHDVVVVARNPAAEGRGPVIPLRIEALRIQVRKKRPAGGDWDAGGNPLAGRLPKKIPLPEDLEGLEMVPPDLRAKARWSAGGLRTSPEGQDDHELVWKDVDWTIEGRAGVGDGLFLEVVDNDVNLDDPVGVVFLSFERLLEAAGAETGELVHEAPEHNGVERVRVKVAPVGK